ncbi:MAG: 5'-methylthioadenosine/S-adenosylhomocysteine nucleosidase [Epsilonproteobacteria bacterium]|nr:5'-methylthioadenosine/S-adenosylhomocysteine nucleosidase [Campylobacterota bacterium]
MIVCAGKTEEFSFALPIGVGLIQSAINLTRLALFDKPEYLLFIGTAGSYGKYKIFDIVESTIASNIEISFFEGKSYTPIDNVISSQGFNVSHETFKKVIVNSSNYICTDKEISKRYLKYGIEIENMEFYSVINVAKEYEIPVKGVFAVTNYTDKNAHKEYMQNYKKAKDILINYLKEEMKIIK